MRRDLVEGSMFYDTFLSAFIDSHCVLSITASQVSIFMGKCFVAFENGNCWLSMSGTSSEDIFSSEQILVTQKKKGREMHNMLLALNAASLSINIPLSSLLSFYFPYWPAFVQDSSLKIICLPVHENSRTLYLVNWTAHNVARPSVCCLLDGGWVKKENENVKANVHFN